MDVKELFCNILNLEETSELFGEEFSDIPIIFRDPDCKAYGYAHVHIATMKNKPVLVFDLVKKES